MGEGRCFRLPLEGRHAIARPQHIVVAAAERVGVIGAREKTDLSSLLAGRFPHRIGLRCALDLSRLPSRGRQDGFSPRVGRGEARP